MQTHTTLATICTRTGLTKARVARWISDGNFAMADTPENGKARTWDLQNTIRLLAVARLIDAGCAVEVGRAVDHLHGLNYRHAYLVVTATAPFGSDRFAGVEYAATVEAFTDVVDRLQTSRNVRAIFVVDLDDVEQQAVRIMERRQVEDGAEA